MSRLVSVKFRGQDTDIEIDRDYGYEPDSNAHDIEWHFVGLSREECDALNITDEEEQEIYEQLCQYLNEQDNSDCL